MTGCQCPEKPRGVHVGPSASESRVKKSDVQCTCHLQYRNFCQTFCGLQLICYCFFVMTYRNYIKPRKFSMLLIVAKFKLLQYDVWLQTMSKLCHIHCTPLMLRRLSNPPFYFLRALSIELKHIFLCRRCKFLR